MSMNSRAMAKVEKALRSSGQTLASFAMQLGVRSQDLNNWKKRGIPRTRQKQVADALGWTLDQLLSEAEGMPVTLPVARAASAESATGSASALDSLFYDAHPLPHTQIKPSQGTGTADSTAVSLASRSAARVAEELASKQHIANRPADPQHPLSVTGWIYTGPHGRHPPRSGVHPAELSPPQSERIHALPGTPTLARAGEDASFLTPRAAQGSPSGKNRPVPSATSEEPETEAATPLKPDTPGHSAAGEAAQNSGQNAFTIVHHLLTGQPGLIVARHWMEALEIQSEDLTVLEAADDCMEPLLYAGDSLLVDRGDVTIRDGQIYAIAYHQSIKVRRLLLRYDNCLVLRCETRQRHPDELLSAADAQKYLRILGRVVWRGGTL